MHDEQVKLLYHADYEYYCVALPSHEGLPAMWYFGHILRIEEWLARQLAREDNTESLEDLVTMFFRNAAFGYTPAIEYSAQAPNGIIAFHGMSRAWPIDRGLFAKASAVAFDMAHPQAPINDLEDLIEQVKEVARK